MPQKKSASADLSVILIYCLFLSVRQKGTSHLSRTLWGNLLAGGWRFYFLTLYCCLGWVGDSYLRSKTSNIWGITSPRRYWRLRCTCSAISLKVRHWAQKSVIWLFKLVRLSACKVVRMWSCPRKRGKHRRKGANQAASEVLQTFPFFWHMQVFRGRKFILPRFSRFPDTKKYVSLHIFEVCDVAAFLKFASFDTRCVANVVCQKRARW